MSTLQFHSVELFGGAITVDLPTAYQDVSSIRQVPDHQEVYLDLTGYTSIVFDILERVSAVNDDAALGIHVAEILSGGHDDDGDGNQAGRVEPAERATFAKMPNLPVLTTTTKTAQAARVGVVLVLLRLEAQATDVLVTVNVPYVREGEEGGEEGARGRRVLWEEGLRVREKVLESLEIRDWGLFGENV